MTERAQSATFAELARELIAGGKGFRFQARGRSMLPSIEDGDILHVLPSGARRLKIGDIVLFLKHGEFKAHRIVGRRPDAFITRGDASMETDGIVGAEQIIGIVAAQERKADGRITLLGNPQARLRFLISQARRTAVAKLRRWSASACLLSLVLLALANPSSLAWGQGGGVALDNTNSQGFHTPGTGCTGAGSNFVCSFNHTTNSVIGNTGLLVVGVSMNFKSNAGSSVTGVTYNGTALTQAAVHTASTFLAGIWYLKNPPVGTFSVAVSLNKTGGNVLGLYVGAITVYQVNLSGSITSVEAGGVGNTATVTIASAANNGVIDNLGTEGGVTSVTPGSGQTQQWFGNSTGSSAQDVVGSSSSAGGAASVTMQETLGASANWALVALNVPAANPTAVRVNSFNASPSPIGAALSWKSGAELHNLGYNVYRDVAGQQVKLNPSLIAGSALLMRDALQQHGAKSYGWIDRSPVAGAVYWLEDVDLNRTRTMHGPVSVDSAVVPSPAVASPTIGTFGRSRMQTAQLNSAIASTVATVSGAAHVLERTVHPGVSSTERSAGFRLAASPAVKILVDHEGWYRVPQPQLTAAGLGRSGNGNANLLHLYAEGVEQPIRVTGGTGFGPQSAIEFYGTAIDTPSSGQRAYWLVEQGRPGLRIAEISPSGTAGPQAQTFTQTLELKPRSTYFAALLREDTDNFFGPLVSPTSDIETINVANLAGGEARLSVVLQGVTEGQQHDVTVMLNGSTLGDVTFADQQEGRGQFVVSAGTLTNGANTVTLTAQQGTNDISLVDTITLSFPHTYTAESDLLKFTADAGQSIAVDGFVQAPSRLVDITDPLRPVEISFSSTLHGGSYTLQSAVPWTTSGQHTLLALSDAQLASPVNLIAHQPSRLHMPQAGAEFVVVTAPQFTQQMQPLAAMHQAEGKSAAVIGIDQIYDEFNFGEPSPFAIRTFLKTATNVWKAKPSYMVLAGDASVDPRNYLGFGFFDFVPTKIVPTAELKTASDDWFSDFNNTGIATIATGRLPARTTSDAQTMVSKIVGYATGAPGGWSNQALLVADVDDPGMSFTQAAQSVQKLLPSAITATDVFAGTLGVSTARQDLINGINSGQLLVNYNGHGSVEIWGGSNLFDDTIAASLTNGSKLPLFVIMNCLNGFFHDVYTQSLAESLMLSPNGGAVAVWASSGLTNAEPQFQMNDRLMQTLFSAANPAVGDAVITAKSGITDMDVKRTFILFGDPAMRLQTPAGTGQVLRLPEQSHLRSQVRPGER